MGITEVKKEENRRKLYRSRYLEFKARHEYGDVQPPYDVRKDPAVLKEKLSIAADYEDDDWWATYFKDRGNMGSIFKAEAKDEVKEGQQ